jgi:ATP phosphoribosyltransferase
MLRLVIPKGSLEQQTLRLFEEADLRVRRGSDRDYHGTIDDERIERVSLLRPQEIPTYVQDGLFDLGITGQDWIAETGAEVEVLTSLSYAKSGTGHGTNVVLAVPTDHPANSAREMPAGSRISTEFERMTRRYFEDLGIGVHVVWSFGATEAKVPEIVDAIVDIAETGSTLRAHGMKIIETLMTSEPVLVANREAVADPAKRRAMDDITTLLLGALAAEGRVLIKLNVSEADRAKVLEVVPSMKSPTVSPLQEGGFAIETVVDKSQVNRLIPELRPGRFGHPRAPHLEDRPLTYPRPGTTRSRGMTPGPNRA